MIREFFELLSILDWITPTKGFIEDVINDPTPFQSNSWTYFIPFGEAVSAGWSPSDIEDLLAKHGIKTWGSQITGGEFFFSTRLENAGWAEYVLLRYGVPIAEHSLDPPRPKPQRRQSILVPEGGTKVIASEGDTPLTLSGVSPILTASNIWRLLRR